jgi:cytidylate kinase
MRPDDLNVAIDGPAGVGKTTTARALAKRMRLLYVDTGAMYRALALAAVRAGLPLDHEESVCHLARRTRIRLEPDDGGVRVFLDGEDVTDAIRTRDVSDAASRVSVHPSVRHRLVEMQRDLARGRAVVMEGRDIGTVVLPDAQAKIYLDATPEERALRRWRERTSKGEEVTLESVREELVERDRRDMNRSESPLRPASDAVRLDCTEMDVEAQVAAVERIVEERISGKG